MELALKALISEYAPTILLIEDIVAEDRNCATTELAKKVMSLIQGTTDRVGRERIDDCCALGITKYSRNAYFKDFKNMQESQRAALEAPSVDEIKKQGAIDAFKQHGSGDFKSLIASMEEELKRLESDRKNRSKQPLEKTPEQEFLLERLEIKENEILETIGLKHVVKFRDLENEGRLQECYHELFSLPLQPCRIKTNLDPIQSQLLTRRFMHNMKPMLEESEKNFPNVRSFKESVETSSLVATLSESLPQVGKFLHLNEMDRSLVRYFDKEIVKSCIDVFMEEVVRTSSLGFILEKRELFETTEEGRELNKLTMSLVNFINGRMGRHIFSNDNEQNEAAKRDYLELEARQRSIIQRSIDVEERFSRVPKWAKGLMIGALLIPFVTYKAVEFTWKTVVEETTKKELQAWAVELNGYIVTRSSQLQKELESLQIFKEIEVFVQNQEEIDGFFYSNADNQDKLNCIKQTYGKNNEWEGRVQYIASRLGNFPNLTKNATLSTVSHLFNPLVRGPAMLNAQLLEQDPVIPLFWQDALSTGKELGLNIQVPLSRVLLGAAILKKYNIDY